MIVYKYQHLLTSPYNFYCLNYKNYYHIYLMLKLYKLYDQDTKKWN